MNISYNWLKDLIDIDLSAADTAAALTRVGLAVEGLLQHGDDYVFDIDLTSNRPDCLSHLGVARELSVSLARPIKLPAVMRDIPMPPVLAHGIVRIDAPEFCHRFTARIIRDVKVGPSPKWLVDRLEAIGERSINNVADITNYIMHELGQPMHAFDLDKLAEKRLVVRLASADELITTLDGVERVLNPSMLAICDAERPVAIAGVMGGLDSSISGETINVLLEVACFNSKNVRATSRELNLATEASYRFERGVDIENLIRASDRATALICDLAGGDKGELIDLNATPLEQCQVSSDNISQAVRRLTGLIVDTAECRSILTALGVISVAGSPTYIAPSWRHDMLIEEDLVEEVARHVGYEKIAEELPPAFGAGEYQPGERRLRSIRSVLTGLGYDEAISYSFIDTKNDGLFTSVPDLLDQRAAVPYVTLQDSVIEGSVRMRPTALPGLLGAIRLNLNHQRRDVRLFEIGKVFAASGENGPMPVERQILALAATGGETLAERALPVRDLDLYDIKGALEAALDVAGVKFDFEAGAARHLRRGQTATVSVEGKQIGHIGRLDDAIASEYKFRNPVYLAEVDLDAILAADSALHLYEPLARFPSSTRDVTFVVTNDLSIGRILSTAREVRLAGFVAVQFVDVFEGKGLGADERAVTIRLEYRRADRTLTEDEVETAHSHILDHLAEKLSIRPRG